MANNKPTQSRLAQRAKERQNSGTKTGHPKKKQSLIWRIFKWGMLAFVALVIAGIGLFAWYASSAPELTQAKLKSDGSSVIYDANNKEITTLGMENRRYASSKDIPQTLKNAVVSIEDRRFYNEPFGIDPIRIVGAAFSNATSGGLQGGSTLTQQLVKLSVFSTKASDQTIKRKAQEAWLAVQVEQKYSKDQILEYYINKVYMNYGQYGMGTAAHYYFNKSLSQLSLAQTAFIAGLAQSPSGYDPFAHPVAAKTRRDEVISAMLRDKKITSAQATTAKATPITSGMVKQTTETNSSDTDNIIDSYLTQVIKEVKKRTGLNPYTTGMKIYTNLDLNSQKKLYSIVNTTDYVAFDNDKLQAAVTMTDPQTGKVIAEIGGRKTGDVKLAYNRAADNDRSNGSNMKPLMDYGPAIEYLGLSTASTSATVNGTTTSLADAPYTYPGTNISVSDWDNSYLGTISIRTALEQSRNVTAIKTLHAVGLTKANSFLKGLGITLPTGQQSALSSGIGGAVSSVSTAAAYGAFANGGTYYAPYYVRKVTTADGVSTSYSSSGSRAMKSSTAYMVTDMLKGVMTGTGTGTSAKVSSVLYEAGKTGTVGYSDDEISKSPTLSGTDKDIWFTGYTKNRVISVWTGYDKSLQNGVTATEAGYAKQIYKSLMTYEVSTGLPNTDWTMPSNVTAKTVNGKRELFVVGSDAYNNTSADAVSSSTVSTSSVLSSSTVTPSSSSVSSSSSASSSSVISSSSSVVQPSSSSSAVISSSSSSAAEPASSSSETSATSVSGGAQ